MTITSITQTTAGSVGSTHRRQGPPPPPPKMDATAKLLGTSTDDLQSQLGSGSTLEDIASSKGVSQDDLLSAIKTDLKNNKPGDAPDLSDDQLTAFATKVAESKGPQGPGGPGGPGGGGPGGPGGPPPTRASSTEDTDTNISSLADALGTDKDSLVKMLGSVQDFGALLAKSGVTGYGSAGNNVPTSSLAVDTYA